MATTPFIKKSIIVFVVFLMSHQSFSMMENTQMSENLHSVLFLIDISGSMKGAKIDSVKSATKRIVRMLLPCNTEFSVMAYSGKKESPAIFNLPFSNNESKLVTFIDGLKAEGGTPLGAALKRGSFYFTSDKNPKSVQQTIILLSDGRSDDNISEALKELKERKSTIKCECIGFDIVNDKPAQEQLKLIAKETGGEYYVASDVSNVVKAFLKSSIKTIIREIPLEVRKSTEKFNFPILSGNVYRMLTNQNWVVDSIQVNVSNALFDITQLIAEENMQDTLPKSLVFDNSNTVSLFINKGTDADINKKWIEGKFRFDNNTLSITVKPYFLKLVIKKIEKNYLVLCVNKFKNLTGDMDAVSEEVCDCNNKMNASQPYIFIYFSQAGCNN